ncbi:alpha/beta hydrolase family protein [Jannaschia donghaensis]|uniref:Putative hydrolase of the alpha/beta-hydrolase fold protein n=1 Tax=Jannaschia donghaensis TaxID=420998 RepID=A0A0M6YIQ5_9RHOB|nr:alpha/beta fold hydrolase [Jannaschia donghaensis]CTQ49804.1 putative hydrolase of the alpha/beta-hydrolase fold protein [Jannaschia donghaensis]
MNVSTTQNVTIPSGPAALAGTLFVSGEKPKAAVVLHAATGVPARFYAAFATWLSRDRGIACLTYDYRDFGASGSAQGSAATMTDWGVHDQQAARDWLRARLPEAPLWVIGHSLGGMMLPYQTGLASIARVVTVASGAVNVRDHPWPYQAFARAFWAPGLGALSRRIGRFPTRALRIGHDLPAGVYAQWRQWCTSPAFQRDDADLPVADATALTCPMRVVAVSDDALCPPAAVWRLMTAYPGAMKRQVVLDPRTFGMARIGHLDPLGERGRPLWPTLIAQDLPSRSNVLI